MKTAVKTLLVLALVLTAATSAWAQAAGNWQRIHGHVQAVQGNQLTLKADDGRLLTVDVSQVSQSVRGALTPNEAVTIVGFPATEPNRFTARYIAQDGAGPAGSTAAAAGNTVSDRMVPLIPKFIESKEFQDVKAGIQNNRTGAQLFVTQVYQGFHERAPSLQERTDWAGFLMQSGDVRGMTEMVVKSPEYAQKNKNDQQAIRDLYEGLLGRAPSTEEVRTWEQQIAQVTTKTTGAPPTPSRPIERGR
jgi:uncharacterized protein DUF4214